MLEYVAALFLCGLILAPVSNRPMARTWLAIACNWAANTAFVLMSGMTTPWLWFALCDAVAARVVLKSPAGRTQSAIGWIYIAQIIVHFTYGVTADASVDYDYWLLLTRLACVQLVILGGWGVGRWGKTVRSYMLRRRASLAGRARHGGLGR